MKIKVTKIRISLQISSVRTDTNKQILSFIWASQPFEGRHITFVHAGVSVLENCQFVDFPKLFKQGFQVFFFQVPRYLPDKQFNGILVLHVAALRMN